MKNTLGERIKLLREAKGWRQDELAQKIGLNRETASKSLRKSMQLDRFILTR